jgi:superfamily II DNA or RNA helicase
MGNNFEGPDDVVVLDGRHEHSLHLGHPLLALLPQRDADELAFSLGARVGATSSFGFLASLAMTKGSKIERRLFEALGVVPVAPEEKEQLPTTSGAPVAYGLFEHQRIAARQTRVALDDAPNRVVLHMPTGAGKTRTAMHLVAEELRRVEPSLVVWLAYSEELCEQAASEFETAWRSLGDREVPVHRYWGNRQLDISSVHDGLLVAGLAKTFARARSDMDFMVRLADRARLVVIDEAHQAIAPTYRFLLEVLVERNLGSRLLGLTATPGRTWNDPEQDRKLADFFHRQKVTLKVEGYSNPVDYLIDDGYLARPTFEQLTYSEGESLSRAEIEELAQALDVPLVILQRLASDEKRNLLILQRAERLTDQHSRILLFATTVEHALALATILRARGYDASAITASTPAVERQRLVAKFKGNSPTPMILCNYGVLTTGFDAPRTSAAIIARPTKSLVLYSQMVGRATRGPLAGGNSEALIVTVVDTRLPGFGQMSDAFTNWEDVW